MGTHLMDSNAVIEFLGGVIPTSGSQWLQNLIDNEVHCLSIINRIELLSYKGTSSDMHVLTDFIDASNVLLLTEPIVLKTIEIRQQTKIKLPDAIIAATALVHQLCLVSRNTDDFKNVWGLSIVNPHLV
jgi:predicted nucleic acid-binding protein